MKENIRTFVEFLTTEGCTAVDIHSSLRTVQDEVKIDAINVRRWVEKFKEVGTSVEV